jgi:hypothetical protein
MRLRRRFGVDTSITPILRQDGTVHFRYPPKPVVERLCEWSLAFLWILVPVVVIATIVWA